MFHLQKHENYQRGNQNIGWFFRPGKTELLAAFNCQNGPLPYILVCSRKALPWVACIAGDFFGVLLWFAKQEWTRVVRMLNRGRSRKRWGKGGGGGGGGEERRQWVFSPCPSPIAFFFLLGSSPKSSKITLTKGKERRKRKSEEKERRGREKSNGCTPGFYNGYFGDTFCQKKKNNNNNKL